MITHMLSAHGVHTRSPLLRSLLATALVAGTLLLPPQTTTAAPAAGSSPSAPTPAPVLRPTTTPCVQNIADSGSGSLRDCLENGTNPIVDFAPLFDSPQTITLSSQLYISRSVVLSRPLSARLTLDGNHSTTILNVAADVQADLAGLDFFDGFSESYTAIIHNYGTLTLQSSKVFSNYTDDGSAATIRNDISATLVMTNVTVAQNTSTGTAGVNNSSQVIMHDVTFDGNQFGDNDGAILSQGGGGAVMNITNITITANHKVPPGSHHVYYAPVTLWNGKMTMTHFLIADNTGDNGGGLYVDNPAVVSLRDGTFYSNTAYFGGGAIHATGKVDIVNTTFHHNVSINDGGALRVYPYSSSGISQIFLTNTTFFSNSAAGAGAVAFLHSVSSTISFVNTVFADNEPGNDCTLTGGATVVGHHNLTTDASCGFTPSADPGLSAFGPFGGFAPTAPLLPNSPAIDAGDPAACPATDQRGLARVGVCDIGAVEASFDLAVVSGTPQSTTVKTTFAQPLIVAYTSPFGEPVGPGGLITFTAPSSGASIAPSTILTGVADASGRVTTTLAANNTAGSYAVTIAAVSASAPITANFTNKALSTPTATPTATPTNTPTATPTNTPTSVPPSPTPTVADPYVSPSYGPPTTSTVSIISPAGGLTGATGVYVKGVKMFHVVRTDKKIDFTMKTVVAVAGTTVDVVLVKAGGVVMTFTQSYSFQAPTTVTGTTASGAVLTTTTGVTVTVPPQTALRPAAPITGTLVITYAQVDTPAEPPGDVPLSFFNVSMDIDGIGVSTLVNPATLELPVDAAMVPPGQRPWLFEWTADGGPLTAASTTDNGRRTTAVGGRWSAVPSQTYDPATGLVTAPIWRLGTYVLVTAAMRWSYFPQVGNIYAPLDSRK